MTARRLAGLSAFAAVALLATAPVARAQDAPAAAPAAARPQKTLRVATSGDYAPFSFSSGESADSLDGFDVEVAKRFAKDRGYALELVRFRWPDLGTELARGTFDVAMSGVTVRAERSIAGRYSVPVAATHAVALTWKGSGAATASDLDRPARRIAVNAGGHLESVARRAFRRADIVAVADNDSVRMALLDRAFDAVVSDSFEEKVWTAGIRDIVRIGPLTDDRKAYLLPADRGAIAAELDAWLVAREKDGTLAGLRTKYFAAADPLDAMLASATEQTVATAEPIAALAAAIAERQALMPMVFDAKHEAGRPVEDRAQETAVLDAGVRAMREAAGAAGRTAPDDVAARRLFQSLMDMGKDVQTKLAEDATKRRPGVIVRRKPDASDPEAAAMPPPPSEPPRQPGDKRIYSLDTELRPALARITEKIARILATIDAAPSIMEVRRTLGDTLASHNVGASRIDELSRAIVALSNTRE